MPQPLTFFVDSDPMARWQLWVEDTFDRETPRQVEASGQGLAAGLIELWTRHLFGGVSDGGHATFTHYNLWWRQRSISIEIAPDPVALRRLRHWLLGETAHGLEAAVATGDRHLQAHVAAVHGALVTAGAIRPSTAGSLPLLEAAAATRRGDEFQSRLEELAGR
mgnify:CR=1 FL=1